LVALIDYDFISATTLFYIIVIGQFICCSIVPLQVAIPWMSVKYLLVISKYYFWIVE